MSKWKNAPWHPAAHLSLCGSEACDDPVYDETDPDVCLRCSIARPEHARPVTALIGLGRP